MNSKNEKRQIAAVLKELQKHRKEQDLKTEEENLILAIAATTGDPIELVRNKFYKVQLDREDKMGTYTMIAMGVGAIAITFGLSFLLH